MATPHPSTEPVPAASGDAGGPTPRPSDATQVRRTPAPQQPARGPPGLLLVASPQPALIGTFFELRDEIVIGRGAEADVRVEDGGLSRRHLLVARGPGGDVVAHDLASTNGTFVNGVKLRSAVLAPGDRIQVGTGTELLFGPLGQGATQEVRLRQALAAAGVGAWEWDAGTGDIAFSGGVAGEVASSLESTDPRPGESWARIHEADREALRERLRAVAGTGGRLEVEVRLLRGDGGVVWLAMKGEGLADESGRSPRVAGTAVDVTDRKRAEEEQRRAMARLQVAERLASLATLSAGVAHQINNPLAFVAANLSWLKGHLAEASAALGPRWGEIESALSDCEEGAERIRRIVLDLNAHAAGGGRAEADTSDVNAVLDFALRVADNEVRHRARVVRDLQPVPRVHGDHVRLGQVFLNIVVNAAQAIEPGRADRNHIRVSTRHAEAAGRVLVEIEDTGAGMDRETASRAFDPFFTTRPIGSGSGLGLFICHGIVTALGGEIAAESAPGQGTTFRLSLPAVAGARPAAQPRARVLVVDDEPLLCLSVQRVLSPRQDVVTCTDPLEALRRVEAGERFDVALIDVAMPRMNGVALHARLREVAPALAARAVMLHGGALDDATVDLLERRGVPRISKPFDIDGLAALVESMVPAASREA